MTSDFVLFGDDDNKQEQSDFQLFDDGPEQQTNQFQLFEDQESIQSTQKPELTNEVVTEQNVGAMKFLPTIDELKEEVSRGFNITKEKVVLPLGALSSEILDQGPGGLLSDEITNPDISNEVLNAQRELDAAINAPSDTIGGRIARDSARLLTAMPLFVMASRSAGASNGASFWLGGLFSDMFAFDHTEERLSNAVAQLQEGENVPFIPEKTIGAAAEILAADPDDSLLVGKSKQAVEGILFGELVGQTFRLGGRAIGATVRGAKGVTHKTTRAVQDAVESIRTIRRGQRAAVVGQTPDTISLRTPPSTRPPATQSALNSLDGKIAQEADRLLRQPFKKGAKGEEAAKRLDILTEAMRTKIGNIDADSLLSPEDVEFKLNTFRRQASRRLSPPPGSEDNGRAVLNAFDENVTMVSDLEKANRKSLSTRARQIVKSTADRSAILKESLRKSGPLGERAVVRLELAQGATAKATARFRETVNEVFPIMSKQADQDNINKLITLRRLRAIKASDPDYAVPLGAMPSAQSQFGKKAGKRITAGTMEDAIQQFRLDVGEEAFTSLSRRADRYFQEMVRALDDMLDAGLISDDEYLKLARFEFSPTQYIDRMDPILFTLPGGKGIRASRSLIKELGKGQEELLLTSHADFLGEHLSRAYRASFFNKANQALHKMASEVDHPLIKTERPKGIGSNSFQPINVFFDGEPSPLFIHRDILEQWRSSASDMVSGFDVLQHASGASVVRFGATGAGNPLFFLKAFPRDIMFAWLNAGNGRLFSPVAGLGHLAKDLQETFSDALFRKGKFDTFLDEGGAMEFLAQQGQFGFERQLKRLPKGERAIAELERGMAYLNTTGEVWVRLAVMNRALKNGLPMEQAVHEGRRLIDFAQGGMFFKQIDKVAPYANAAIQGFRGTARAATTNPREFAAKSAMLMGLFGSAYYTAHVMYPEEYKQVPKHDRDRNIIIMTPFWREHGGAKRNIYYKIPIDHSVMPLKVAADTIMDAHFTDEVPADSVVRFGTEPFQLLPGVGGIPLANAWATWLGVSPLTGQQIDPIQFRDVLPEDQYRSAVNSINPTSKLAQVIAQSANPQLRALGLDPDSPLMVRPARLDRASRALLPSNVLTDLMGRSIEEELGGLEELDQYMQQMGTRFWNDPDNPATKAFIGETNPFLVDTDVKITSMEASSSDFKRSQEIKGEYEKRFVDNGSRPLTRNQIRELEKFVERYNPMERKKAIKQIKDMAKIDEVFSTFNPDTLSAVPSRAQWFRHSFLEPQAKAQWLVGVLSEAEMDVQSGDKVRAKEGRAAKRMIRSLLATVPGYSVRHGSTPTEFGVELQNYARDRGVALP